MQSKNISRVWLDIINLGNVESEFANFFKWRLGSGRGDKILTFGKVVGLAAHNFVLPSLAYLIYLLAKIVLSGTCTLTVVDSSPKWNPT